MKQIDLKRYEQTPSASSVRPRAMLIAAMAIVSGAALAQTGAYYVTQGTAGPGSTYVMQGGALQFSYNWAADAQMPIVIGDFGSGTRVRQAA
ncbi:MAG: hypothetical protein H0W86_12020, partial [Armatimonadetes bacterium]|nr:hypothetical protein [Armatimonadota bacterium]